MKLTEEQREEKEYRIKEVVKAMNGLSHEGFMNRHYNDPFFNRGLNILVGFLSSEHEYKEESESWQRVARRLGEEKYELEEQLKQAVGVLEGIVSISRETLYEENRDNYALRKGLVNIEARAHRCVSYLSQGTEGKP